MCSSPPAVVTNHCSTSKNTGVFTSSPGDQKSQISFPNSKAMLLPSRFWGESLLSCLLQFLVTTMACCSSAIFKAHHCILSFHLHITFSGPGPSWLLQRALVWISQEQLSCTFLSLGPALSVGFLRGSDVVTPFAYQSVFVQDFGSPGVGKDIWDPTGCPWIPAVPFMALSWAVMMKAHNPKAHSPAK